MDELVKKLSEGAHPVVLSRVGTTGDLAECIERGYLLVEFTGTRGGTELGVQLNSQATELEDADLEQGSGTARLVGDLTINGVDVLCLVEIDVATFRGSGHLAVLH